MTRIEKLKSMKGSQLIKEADKLGVKVRCDMARTKLVEAKATLIERILAFEADQNVKSMPENDTESIEMDINKITQDKTKNASEANEDDEKHALSTHKRGALIEYNGKSQNICKWANELGISANTLYGRLYKLGWTIEKAFTTKGRK